MARGLTMFSPSQLRAHRMNAAGHPNAVSMTAEELADAVGATKAQILAYENGHRVPDPPRVRALADALGIPPWGLMNTDGRDTWTLADYRRAAGLRAQDVVEVLGVSPKNYRRFENEGIVPTRSAQFIDQVAEVLKVQRSTVETAIDRTPAVQRRQARAAELVESMANRYVSEPGIWRGPKQNDPELIELAEAYGRSTQRIRRVLTYELGEVRQGQVRAEREKAIARYDPDRGRQIRATHAYLRWQDVFAKEMARIPQRLERFHRTAQPADVWELLVDLYNVDATVRPDTGSWAPTVLLCPTPEVLPRYFVEQSRIDGVAVCRLTAAGLKHIATFAGLYAALYPGTRKPIRPGRVKTRGPGGMPETFTLPNRAERLVVPQPLLESARKVVAATKASMSLRLSSHYDIAIGAQTLSAATTDALFVMDD